ncbi:uncharacterized protein LOC142182092 [Nicotiana tabacum]|uniref:Uncharacterized protein LOC142182092 n=1 Tax=Nicotiana tabacum TaxID=4097 RepID=A0AC58USE9_TOBAC
MEHQLGNDDNPQEIPPQVHVDEQFDEVVPRPANRILRDYARPNRFNCESSVRKPPVAANNFEIRTDLIQTIQQSCIFTGDSSEDPHSHLIDFLELVETAKYNGVPPEAIKNVIDAAAGGSVMGKTTEEALQLLNKIYENVIQWSSERVIIKKTATVNQVDALNTLTQQIVSLAQKFESFQVNTQQSSKTETCDMCGGNHLNHECQAISQSDEQVNVIGYKQYPFGSPMAQKYPGFQWSNPNGAENSQSFQKQ